MLFLAAILVLVICGILYWLSGCTAPQLLGKAYWSARTDRKVIALTFDDGPIEPTGEILDILKSERVKATFFVLGKRAEKKPEILRRIRREGHEIGNHTWSHAKLIGKSLAFIRDQIERTDAVIRASGYAGPIYFRSPHGAKLFALPWVLKKMGRQHILFDIRPKDWQKPAADIMVQRIMDQIHPGGIVIMHDSPTTAKALKRIIAAVKGLGYEFLTVSDLLAEDGLTAAIPSPSI
jgi:peptidoglycan/xylan/chitin deacetylase (PgdA/CDA1 family)